jgi:Sigma-70, region 4
MPARRMSMRKTKEVLRLKFELGLGQRQIARSCGMGVGTVHNYLERAVAAGIGWPLPEGLSEEELEAKLFGNQPVRAKEVRQRPQPDWKAIHRQLQQHRHLTLQFVWEEYRQAHPEGYRYSWFCERYQHWRRHLDVVLRQEHKVGEKMFVDWAEATIPVYDATTGQAWPASLFVPCWAQVLTPTQKRLAISSWKPGSRRTSTRWSFSEGCRPWRCPITRKRPSPGPAATIRI